MWLAGGWLVGLPLLLLLLLLLTTPPPPAPPHRRSLAAWLPYRVSPAGRLCQVPALRWRARPGAATSAASGDSSSTACPALSTSARKRLGSLSFLQAHSAFSRPASAPAPQHHQASQAGTALDERQQQQERRRRRRHQQPVSPALRPKVAGVQGVGEAQAVLGAREADVEEAPLLGQRVWRAAAARTHQRHQALVTAWSWRWWRGGAAAKGRSRGAQQE